MQSIFYILNATGMSQEMLASYIGLSRQTIIRIKNGYSGIDADGSIKLARLQQCIIESAAAGKEPARTTIQDESDKERLAECRYQLSLLNRKLAANTSCRIKGALLLRSLERLQPENEQEALWIKKTKITIIKKLDKSSEADCMRLRKQIFLLEAEAEYIGRFVNEDPPM